MNKHCLFGQFPGPAGWLLGFDQILGYSKFILWARFLHQSCAIMCLVSCPIGFAPIGFAPIEPTPLKLQLPKSAGLTSSPAGHLRQHT